VGRDLTADEVAQPNRLRPKLPVHIPTYLYRVLLLMSRLV
jgi:hypothetical protein